MTRAAAWAAALLLLAWSAVASASEAERTRLRRELRDHAARSAWEGVERTYRAMVQLRLPLSADDHVLGYQAALQRGDPLLAAMRLSRAPDEPSATPGDAQASPRQLRDALLGEYGLVAIVVEPSQLRRLERDEAPFSPHQRAAIAHAQKRLREDGEARALLPTGSYDVAGRSFQVQAGADWQVLVVRED